MIKGDSAHAELSLRVFTQGVKEIYMIMHLASFLAPQNVQLIASRLCQSETAELRAVDRRRISSQSKSVLEGMGWVGIFIDPWVEANR